MLSLNNLFRKSSKSRQSSSRGRSKIINDAQVVISAITDGVLAISRDGNVHLASPAAEEILGWDEGDTHDLNFHSVLKLVDSEGTPIDDAVNPIAKALRDFQPFSSRDLYAKTQSGKVIPVNLSIRSIDEDGSGIIIVFRNIAKELKESREQSEFISTASHEMRTPVASIEGYLALAINPTTATIDDRAREYINKAHEQTTYLGNLLRDLLDITKADDGRLKNNPKVTDITKCVRGIWEDLKVKATDKGLQYIYEPDELKSGSEKHLLPVFYANVDKDHLREALNNLIENAIKYTQHGKVTVGVVGDSDTVRITIQDSGIGIPKEDIPHLFQKFYRVDDSDTREIGGTGLGLYLSRRLTESMGGKINVESEYQKGSKFIIVLPRLTRDEALRLQGEQDKVDWNVGNTVPEEDVKLTSPEFVPFTKEKAEKQKMFSAQDVAELVKKEMEQKEAQTTAEQQPPAQQPIQTADTTSKDPIATAQPAENNLNTAIPIQQTAPRPAPRPLPPMPRQPAANNRPAPIRPNPLNPYPQAPIAEGARLTDIEKMKEDYLRQMVANRQNTNSGGN